MPFFLMGYFTDAEAYVLPENGPKRQIQSPVRSQCLGNKVSVKTLPQDIETRSQLKLIKTEIQPGHNKTHDLRGGSVPPPLCLMNERENAICGEITFIFFSVV